MREERTRALGQLADRIEAEESALAAALVADVHLTVRNARRDLEHAVFLLRQHACRPQSDRRPFGKVAIMLPHEPVATSSAATLGAAYLAGNEVIARVPARIPAFLARFRPLVEDSLPGVTVSDADARA